jgi:hypothetical protein
MLLVAVSNDITFLWNSDALYLVDSYQVSEETTARKRMELSTKLLGVISQKIVIAVRLSRLQLNPYCLSVDVSQCQGKCIPNTKWLSHRKDWYNLYINRNRAWAESFPLLAQGSYHLLDLSNIFPYGCKFDIPDLESRRMCCTLLCVSTLRRHGN